MSGVYHGLRYLNFKFGRSIEVYFFCFYWLRNNDCYPNSLQVQSRESALLTNMNSYQNYIQLIHFLETSNCLLSFNRFQFGTLFHFRHHFMTGGSSSKLIWLKEDRALEARVPGGGGGSGGMLPREILKFSFSKTHI